MGFIRVFRGFRGCSRCSRGSDSSLGVLFGASDLVFLLMGFLEGVYMSFGVWGFRGSGFG